MTVNIKKRYHMCHLNKKRKSIVVFSISLILFIYIFLTEQHHWNFKCYFFLGYEIRYRKYVCNLEIEFICRYNHVAKFEKGMDHFGMFV